MARSRSSEAHEKALHAALELFGERGIEGASMDAIAREAGVSKATLYSHWKDKEALLLEAMLHVNGLDDEPEDIDTGDLESDLATVLSRRPPDRFETTRSRMTPMLIAYSATHHEFGLAWRHSVMEPPRQCLRRILRRGIERGFLSADLDLEVAIALLLGPMLYDHIFHKGAKKKQHGMGPEVAEAFCRAFVTKASK